MLAKLGLTRPQPIYSMLVNAPPVVLVITVQVHLRDRPLVLLVDILNLIILRMLVLVLSLVVRYAKLVIIARTLLSIPLRAALDTILALVPRAVPYAHEDIIADPMQLLTVH
jgi:hypothetical protein